MKFINNSKKIKVNVGDVIKYDDKTDPYPRYAMIIEFCENGYSAVVLSEKGNPNLVGQVLLDGVIDGTADSPNTVFQKYWLSWDNVEKVPFFGVEGCPEDYESRD